MVKAMKLQLFYHMTKIDCASSHHEQFNQIINRSNICLLYTSSGNGSASNSECEGAAWLSSARAVRCRLKCHNERNPCCQRCV